MTPFFKSIVSLSAALAAGVALAQSVIEIGMPWPKEGTGFPCGQPVDVWIRHTVDGKATAAKGVKIAFDNFGPKTVRAEEPCDLPEHGLRVRGLTLNEPGFLRCRVTADGKNYVQSVPFEPERIAKGSPTPADFLEYWQGQIAKLDAESPDAPELKPWRGPDTNQWDAWRVSFMTAGGKRVYGLLSVPKNRSKGPFPVHVSVPGAGQPTKTYSASWIYSQTPEPDTVRLTMFAHCAPIDDAKERDAYFTRIRAEYAEKYDVGYYPQAGISESREAYHFHPVILGINRAVNWLARQSYCDTNRFTYSGSSQGGGFGIVLAGLNRHFTRVFADVPAMTDTMGARAGHQSGWPQPVETQRPENRPAAERFAPYFDGANFARHVTCPIRVTCGCKDTTCAPPAVYAAYNQIPSKDKQILVMPDNGHEGNGKVKNQVHVWRQGKGERGLAPFDTLTCEVTGIAFGCGANTDPTFKAPRLVAAIRRTDGIVEDIPLRTVDWMGAYLVNRRFSESERGRFGEKAGLAGVRLEGGAPETNAKIKVEEAKVFKEELKPLSIRVTPRETLPFPNRKRTIIPETAEPAAGDLLAEWNAALPPCCTVSKRRVGKSLVVDITAPAGDVTEIPLGIACEAKKVKSFAVPYLTWGERNGRVHADLLEGGWFRLAEFDWYVSNASDVYTRETNGGRELVARYKPKTDGTFNPVRERIVITLSKVFDEILPEIPNPVSPWKHVTGTHVWRSHAAYDRAEDLALWRQVKAAGITRVAVTDHETMWRDGGEPFTFCTDAAKGKGGDATQKAYTRAMIDELGFRYGPYNNFTDLATQSGFFNRDTVGRWPDGSFHTAWMRCYGPKPVLAPLACDRFAAAVQRKFGFNTAYCDVHTSMLPWQRTDYDARVPGAGTYAQTYYSWGETLLKQKAIWDGPVYSEGSHQFLWAGLADGSYAQDRGYDFRNEPWIVEFELLRTQRLCSDFGMGSLSMFSPARTDLERQYYLPGQPKGRDELVNRFLAATIAFGHSGYLILDRCWDPVKPLGRAYGGECRPVWKEKGLPAETLRSYFMIQALAARYTQSHAVEIRYADAEGRLHAASEAIRNGAVVRNQVVTRYADGTVTAVNGSDSAPMKTSAHGRKIELAPNGFAGWSDGVTVLSTDTGGRRIHYAECPDYVYREIEGGKPYVSLTSRHVFPKEHGRLTGFAFGNGHYLRNPGAFSIPANGHHNATSYCGFEFADGKTFVVGSAAPVTRVWWDPAQGEAGLENDEGAPFRVVEGKDGVFAAVIEYRKRHPRKAAAGVRAKAGKFCVDVWNGTYRQQAEFVRRAAKELGVTNDIFLCTHVWQRHGYDNGLPEVWPPDPAFGTAEDMKALARTCREHGWGFGVHHNVVDFYTNAACFAWSEIARDWRNEPVRAWRNVFRGVQSWRMAPHLAPGIMRRSLEEMNAAGFSPDLLFVDVIGSFPAKPYFDQEGNGYAPAAARQFIGEVFDTIREVQIQATGRETFTASEAAHDYLIGHLDGGDCQFMEVTRETGEYCWNVIPQYDDMEKIPWFDAVNHSVFSLHGVGYSIRYEAGRGELDHGIDSDDYLSAEILTGHALMTDCYSRDVRDVLSGTVRPLDLDRCLNQLKRKWTLAQAVAKELALAEVTGHDFVGGDIHRQKVTWSTGMTVYVNRGERDWRVAGVTLPQYGFLAVNPKTGVRAEISRERPRERVLPKKFLDVTPEEIVRNPRGYQLHFWLARRKPTENSRNFYDRLLKARDETPADCPKNVNLDRLVTVTDPGADPNDVSARYYLNGTPSFDRRFYLAK